ncbi:hypothetical protein J1N35_023607 [Gossypium stocksii]|uniref:Uncharacterized protein n=1 Tax=Gossypium stocksii TaxID=47602 RepID=A0A9D3VJ49_9ROSI|nr:hypothetical protein J1N35_023607 [Gossypium stocksii]
MDAHKVHSERTVRGACGINSHELMGVRSLNSHIPKEFTCKEPRALACELEQYTCSTCLSSTQNVSLMNNEVKS